MFNIVYFLTDSIEKNWHISKMVRVKAFLTKLGMQFRSSVSIDYNIETT